jgi:hypothetical protein
VVERSASNFREPKLLWARREGRSVVRVLGWTRIVWTLIGGDAAWVVPVEGKDGFMIDNEDIGRDIDLLTDQERPLHDNSLATVAKMCLIESIDECKTRGPIHLSRSDRLFILG